MFCMYNTYHSDLKLRKYLSVEVQCQWSGSDSEVTRAHLVHFVLKQSNVGFVAGSANLPSLPDNSKLGAAENCFDLERDLPVEGLVHWQCHLKHPPLKILAIAQNRTKMVSQT